MPLWKKPSSEAEQWKSQTPQEIEASLQSLQAGRLPLQGQQRLRQETETNHPLFTSDLSINEFLLTRTQGYQPLGMVMGSSVYSIRWQYTRNSIRTPYVSELTPLSTAHQQAAQLALNRLEQEAELLNAHGIIGVHFSARKYEWGRNTVEYTAIGTAIRLPNAPLPQSPFLSDLSGQEFWTLLQAGYSPLGLAMGYSAYYASLGIVKSQRLHDEEGGGYRNQPIKPFSQAVSTARKQAMSQLVEMARTYKASSLVGVHINCERKIFETRKHLDLAVFFSVVGTAIGPQKAGHMIQKPQPTFTFTDLRPGKRGETRDLTLKLKE